MSSEDEWCSCLRFAATRRRSAAALVRHFSPARSRNWGWECVAGLLVAGLLDWLSNGELMYGYQAIIVPLVAAIMMAVGMLAFTFEHTLH